MCQKRHQRVIFPSTKIPVKVSGGKRLDQSLLCSIKIPIEMITAELLREMVSARL